MTGRVLALTLVASSVGCGDLMSTYYKSVSTAAVTAAACRDVLSEAHERKTSDVKAKAQAGKPDEAQADLDRWLLTYEKVKQTCGGLKTGAKLALDAAPSVEAAASKKRDVAGWIARLTKLGLDMAKTLTEAGLKLPGGS